jgi:hypothetical protein
MDRLHHLPQLRRWHCLGQHNQELVTAYLTHLQARPYAPPRSRAPLMGSTASAGWSLHAGNLTALRISPRPLPMT